MKRVIQTLYKPSFGTFNSYWYGAEKYLESTRHMKSLLKATSLKEEEVGF